MAAAINDYVHGKIKQEVHRCGDHSSTTLNKQKICL